jgi:hypothetical protein
MQQPPYHYSPGASLSSPERHHPSPHWGSALPPAVAGATTAAEEKKSDEVGAKMAAKGGGTTAKAGEGWREEPEAPGRSPRVDVEGRGPVVSVDGRRQRERKNERARARAAHERNQIEHLKRKGETGQQLDPDEEEKLHVYERKRARKNERSRVRSQETKDAIQTIQAKPEEKRTEREREFLGMELERKNRKIEGDRLRRQRLRELGLPHKRNDPSMPSIPARGPLPPELVPGMMAPPGIVYPGHPPPPPGIPLEQAPPYAMMMHPSALQGHPYGPPEQGYPPPPFFMEAPWETPMDAPKDKASKDEDVKDEELKDEAPKDENSKCEAPEEACV